MVARQYKLFSWRTYFAATLSEWEIYHPELNLVQWPRSLGCLAPIDILMTVLLADASDSEWVSEWDRRNKQILLSRGLYIFFHCCTKCDHRPFEWSQQARPHKGNFIVEWHARYCDDDEKRTLDNNGDDDKTRSSPSAMQSLPRRREVQPNRFPCINIGDNDPPHTSTRILVDCD